MAIASEMDYNPSQEEIQPVAQEVPVEAVIPAESSPRVASKDILNSVRGVVVGGEAAADATHLLGVYQQLKGANREAQEVGETPVQAVPAEVSASQEQVTEESVSEPEASGEVALSFADGSETVEQTEEDVENQPERDPTLLLVPEESFETKVTPDEQEAETASEPVMPERDATREENSYGSEKADQADKDYRDREFPVFVTDESNEIIGKVNESGDIEPISVVPESVTKSGEAEPQAVTSEQNASLAGGATDETAADSADDAQWENTQQPVESPQFDQTLPAAESAEMPQNDVFEAGAEVDGKEPGKAPNDGVSVEIQPDQTEQLSGGSLVDALFEAIDEAMPQVASDRQDDLSAEYDAEPQAAAFSSDTELENIDQSHENPEFDQNLHANELDKMPQNDALDAELDLGTFGVDKTENGSFQAENGPTALEQGDTTLERGSKASETENGDGSRLSASQERAELAPDVRAMTGSELAGDEKERETSFDNIIEVDEQLRRRIMRVNEANRIIKLLNRASREYEQMAA